jgi:glyoxylase-like metal-dependent hydrolase (beta-lactamase superfamily II)/rhodanese-related sulfurtransferase
MQVVGEISAAERELRAGAQIAVLDVRAHDDVARWQIEADGAPFLAVPLADLRERGEDTIAELRRDRALRVICSRGNASRDAVIELERLGMSALSVSGGMIAWSALLVAEPITIGSPAATVVQFRREARGCLSYLVVGGSRALVIDPASSTERYIEQASELGARIVAVLDTHVHADHLSGARALADAPGARLHLSRAAVARGVGFADRVEGVDAGTRLLDGPADVRVVALPGHTSDNVGVLIDDRALVAGDSLFAQGVARPDLEVGDEDVTDAARMLFHTLHERVLSLPDPTLVLPCHYPGGRVSGPITTTVGAARRGLKLLSLDEREFVDAVVSDLPPRPANHRSIIEVNLGEDTVSESAQLEIGANSCAAAPL